MGTKPSQLVLQGQGSTPVIVSPGSTPVDADRYQAVLIRMITEGGNEIKIKFGRTELRQKLAPPMEWKVYRFELPPGGAGLVRPLAIMPTDDLFATVAIDFIELEPRKQSLAGPAGRASIAKRDEYRNTIFVRAPASLAYEVRVPVRGVLHFGLGVSGKQPVTFRILAGPSKTEVFSKTLSDPEAWADGEADMSGFAGTTTRIEFRSESATVGAVGFWTNPLLLGGAPHSRPNVLLYVVCTLRPDHTSLYGYSRGTTPFLKKLGASAVVFDDAVAQASWTKASVPSIMTSLQAYTHSLAREADTIPRGAVTLAERMRQAGYVTASIVANPFAGRASGLERGFDYSMEVSAVQRHLAPNVDRGTDSAAINRTILPWIDQHSSEPFFLFILATDPHAPYQPPKGFEEMYANPAETEQFNRDFVKLRDMHGYGGGATVTREEIRARGIDPDAFIRRAIDRYDGEIAHNDHSIAALFGKLKDTGVLENTLAVIASDHGEEFWEHGLGAHGHSLYSELIHAVLMIWSPKLIPKPRRVAEPVQLIDIMPTVLELAGLDPPAGLEGRSLVPLLRGGALPPAPAMSTKLALPTAKPDGAVPENRTDTIARIEPNWKLIYRTRSRQAGMKEIELYDRRTDRADRNDVAAQRADIAGRMKSEILAWMEREDSVKARIGPGGSTTLDRATIDRLRTLGYIGGKEEKEH